MKISRVKFVPALLLVVIFNSGVHAKTLRYATQDEPQTLDPHSASLAVTTRLLSNIYDPLVGRDKDFKLVPWLALSWSQPDARTWRFKLRPGVKFHDGAAFTADDVVFSVERAQCGQCHWQVMRTMAERKSVAKEGLDAGADLRKARVPEECGTDQLSSDLRGNPTQRLGTPAADGPRATEPETPGATPVEWQWATDPGACP